MCFAVLTVWKRGLSLFAVPVALVGVHECFVAVIVVLGPLGADFLGIR